MERGIATGWPQVLSLLRGGPLHGYAVISALRERIADDSYMDQGIQILNRAQNAHRLFAVQLAKEKRSL